jgi:hypothetical protein
MTSYINIRIKIRLPINDITYQEFVRYLSISDSSTVGDLVDDINRRLEQDNMNGDIYYIFDEQLDNPLTEDSLLGGPLFPRNILLVYTMIENNTTLFVQARLNNNIIRVVGRIYIEETGERLNDMLLNIPYGTTIGALVNYINGELATQFLAGTTYHINSDEEYQISDQTLLGGTIYSSDRLFTDMGIGNNSVLYMNCRITNPLFRNVIIPPPAAVQLPIINIDDQAQLMDLNSFLDVYDTLMNMGVNNVAPLQQNILNDTINNINNLQSLVNILSNPVFTNVEFLNTQNINNRMEDVVVALDKDDLDKLRVSIYTDFECRYENDRDTCSVCFEKFIDSDICRELKCKHLYHQICIDKWLNEHVTCPVCREECGKGVPRL